MKQDTLDFYRRAVLSAAKRVASDLDSALDLDEIARFAAMSPFHFHRVFRGMVGETPLALHRRLRLERAAWMLVETDRRVIDIAFDAGYETHESFTRAFKASFGASPTTYRKLYRTRSQAGRYHLSSVSSLHFCPTGETFPVDFQLPRFSEEPMNVTVSNEGPIRIATVPHTGPYNRINSAFEKLGGIAGPAGLIQQADQMVAIYYDDPETTPLEELRSEAGIIVEADTELPDGLTERLVPGGRFAAVEHAGAYELIGDTWAKLMGQWLPQSGFRVREDDVCYEWYKVGGPGVAPEDLRTVLYLPVDAP